MPHIAELDRGWDDVNTLPSRNMDSPAQVPPPHVPLRKASASRLQARKGPVPKALFPTHNVNHQLRGFNPSPNIVSPHIDHIQASDEHAFAGREPRRPYPPAVGMLESQHQHHHHQQYTSHQYSHYVDGGRPPSSPLQPPPESPHYLAQGLKHSRSMGESLRSRVVSGKSASDKRPNNAEIGSNSSNGNDASSLLTPDLAASATMSPPPAIRESFRSALTSHSSLLGPSSSINTTHTSVSSDNDFVRITTEDWNGNGDGDGDVDDLLDAYGDVDDLLDAYGDGFESDRVSMASRKINGSRQNSMDVRSVRSYVSAERPPSLPRSQSHPRPQTQLTPKKSRFELESVRDSVEVRSVRSLKRRASLPKPTLPTVSNVAPNTTSNITPKRLHAGHRRSQSASILILGVPRISVPGGSSPANVSPVPPPSPFRERSSVQILSGQSLGGTDSRPNSEAIPRDRYGFKKASHYITVEAYDAWNANYSSHIERRSKKWHALMRSYGLTTNPGALRFPPKSDKIKRYVRKGIPPEFRGNAWFWYAGGPGKLAKSPGLYKELLEKVENGGLGDTDREHIERDLQRTFPDNIKFKADMVDGIDGRDSASVKAGLGIRHSGATNPAGRDSRAGPTVRDSSATTGSSYQPAKSSMLRDSSATTATNPLPARDSSMSVPTNGRPRPPTRDSSTPPINEATMTPSAARDGATTPVIRDSATPVVRDSSILSTPPKLRDSSATTSTARSRLRAAAKDAPPETPIIQSLRRVLQAFAVHNPQIGYCQSLNFIAGLLLLFLDSDEEKAFILLEIITDLHLPGTHGIALEGANIDIGVLMSCIKDYLPAVWAKLDDHEGEQRLPTVSLATTAWFMSLFVGTLPIECVLRVWDCLFFEGSKTLFRVAMSIFKTCESEVVKLGDPMEVFQLVQGFPRGLLDANALMEQCFRRRTGFGGISQGLIEGRRADRRKAAKAGTEGQERGNAFGKLRGRLRSTRIPRRRIETG